MMKGINFDGEGEKKLNKFHKTNLKQWDTNIG